MNEELYISNNRKYLRFLTNTEVNYHEWKNKIDSSIVNCFRVRKYKYVPKNNRFSFSFLLKRVE